jgi:hypothetical protein
MIFARKTQNFTLTRSPTTIIHFFFYMFICNKYIFPYKFISQLQFLKSNRIEPE